jgi:hypothetical protein
MQFTSSVRKYKKYNTLKQTSIFKTKPDNPASITNASNDSQVYLTNPYQLQSLYSAERNEEMNTKHK